MNKLQSLCPALLLLLTPGLAWAANEGTAVGVDPDAQAQLSGATRVLQVGTDVSVGEVIKTGPTGQVQIVFDDQTHLVVGPGSSLLIETYLLAGDGSAQKLAIDALGGTFRFMTGNSAKPAYSIDTPTATIAVRGTEFDLTVDRTGTAVMLYEGALDICTEGGSCATLADHCEVGQIAENEARHFVRTDAARLPLALQFRYARFQTGLMDDFQLEETAHCADDLSVPEPATLTSGSTSDAPARPSDPAPAPVEAPPAEGVVVVPGLRG